ncbi:hypothetical protein DPMN_051084 [Dreissena polymorpha]|uniref:Uncharacterized protein n=1 Tax=Dreissena polymorpha TaxID=45954 RepID=A0A9D4CIG0_DREPO|nr:hypothetical protein DPMN_051084 [Dreissena polymorpha]
MYWVMHSLRTRIDNERSLISAGQTRSPNKNFGDEQSSSWLKKTAVREVSDRHATSFASLQQIPQGNLSCRSTKGKGIGICLEIACAET